MPNYFVNVFVTLKVSVTLVSTYDQIFDKFVKKLINLTVLPQNIFLLKWTLVSMCSTLDDLLNAVRG